MAAQAQRYAWTSVAYPARVYRRLVGAASITLLVGILLLAYLSPFGYMVTTALKDRQMMAKPNAPLWPAREAQYVYEGPVLEVQVGQRTYKVEPGNSYPVYLVPTETGTRALALAVRTREVSYFLDPERPEEGLIRWEGNWRTLQPAWEFSPRWDNFAQVWKDLDFPILLRNTFAIAVIGAIGTLISSTLVAYGFSRFRFPGKNLLFIILIGTILLPGQVTLVPTYAFFTRIGWVGTWLPLTVPHFFANAYNVFLLRQFFLTIPRDLDEAAMIDGAGPFRILWSIILPQSWPAVTTVFLFHFMWAWNDFFYPYIYLSTRPDLQPITVGIYSYSTIYGTQPHLIQSAALLGLVVPVVIFFLAQRAIMRGVVITGVEK